MSLRRFWVMQKAIVKIQVKQELTMFRAVRSAQLPQREAQEYLDSQYRVLDGEEKRTDERDEEGIARFKFLLETGKV